MDSTLVTPQSGTSSSFWKTKDGKFGLVISVVLGGLALWGLYLILPFLIGLASNLLTLALLVLALFVIAYVVLDKDVRTFVFYFYKTIIRAFRRLLVNTDPVSIIEVYISDLKKQFDKLEEKIQELSGARRKIDDTIKRSKEELEDQLNLAETGRKKGLSTPEIGVYVNQVGRLTESIKKFQVMVGKLALLNNLLNDMRKACKVIILDKENQVKNIKIEREALNVGFSAFKSAISILKGDRDKKFYYDEAIDAIQNDISMKSGIIEQYINETSEILQMVNLQNSAFEEKGMKLLEKWQTQGMPALLSDGNDKLGLTVPLSVNYEVVTESGGSNAYKNLLK